MLEEEPRIGIVFGFLLVWDCLFVPPSLFTAKGQKWETDLGADCRNISGQGGGGLSVPY